MKLVSDESGYYFQCSEGRYYMPKATYDDLIRFGKSVPSPANELDVSDYSEIFLDGASRANPKW